jgi:hypothetical protein
VMLFSLTGAPISAWTRLWSGRVFVGGQSAVTAIPALLILPEQL